MRCSVWDCRHAGSEKGRPGLLLTNTLTGQANALDITLDATFNTGNAGSNDKFAIMSLSLAQSLYDTAGAADRLTVLLDDEKQTESMRKLLQNSGRGAGHPDACSENAGHHCLPSVSSSPLPTTRDSSVWLEVISA